MKTRVVMLALTLAGNTGCIRVPTYTPVAASPVAFTLQPARSLRVTRTHGARITLDSAMLVGDSLVGQIRVRQSSSWGRERLALAVADIRAIEQRSTDWPVSIAVTTTVAVVTVFALAAVLFASSGCGVLGCGPAL